MDLPSFPDIDLFSAGINGLYGVAVLAAVVFRMSAIHWRWHEIIPGAAAARASQANAPG